MYLSRLFLNDHNRQAAQDLRSAYALHQTLRWAYAGAGEVPGPLPDGERLLWRKDVVKEDDGAQREFIIVQSQTRPDWLAVESRSPGYFQFEPDVKPFDLSGLQAGQQFIFRLRANVTVNRWRDNQNRDEEPRTKREALRGAVEQVAWLERQGERGGFSLISTDIAQSGNVRLYKARGGAPMTLFAVTFEGLLQVEDPAQLAQTVQNGIGKAKALGFGLLSLARA
ncbi:type I-E CRISPR-associated protein Cas6/Cse3/CasE [Deinococcus lacus]|uniref:Type I-E CRISPR-associated protein Cas6/Cse3/CasE n=1 Tax=Deinococcus lacus TaxID=392561 RepID=A0ABW1YHU4_9DEIO